MAILCIRSNEFSSIDLIDEKVIEYIKENCKITKCPIWIFDIHNTIKYDVETNYIDLDVLNLIEHLIKKDYTVLFLSYDGSEKRMYANNNLLNKINTLKEIPKIFIMEREKGIIIRAIQKYCQILNLTGLMDIVFVDDKQDNIDNINKHVSYDNLKKIKSLRYLSRLDINHNIGIKDLNNLKIKYGH